MVRKYKRKAGSRTYAAYSPALLQEAIDKIRGGTLSLRRASIFYRIPRETLSNRVRGTHNQKRGHPVLFSDAEEQSLIVYIQTVSDWGFPFTTLDLRIVAKSYLVEKT